MLKQRLFGGKDLGLELSDSVDKRFHRANPFADGPIGRRFPSDLVAPRAQIAVHRKHEHALSDLGVNIGKQRRGLRAGDRLDLFHELVASLGDEILAEALDHLDALGRLGQLAFGRRQDAFQPDHNEIPHDEGLHFIRPTAQELLLKFDDGVSDLAFHFTLALHRFQAVLRVSRELYGGETLAYLLLSAATLGIPVRLYISTALGFDYADIGRQFRWLFPGVLLLDAAWCATPLLFLGQLQGLVLLCAGALAFLPFSQKTLVYAAYGKRGGRSSAVKSLDQL